MIDRGMDYDCASAKSNLANLLLDWGNVYVIVIHLESVVLVVHGHVILQVGLAGECAPESDTHWV